ncbi:MAG: toll/interleukin-1 receptor domain-containing protein [Caldilineaceae bacterium]
MAERAEVFFSYSRKDRKWVDRLLEILKPLLKERNVSFWSDTKISPGDKWQEAIKNSIDRSQVVILLISPDYLASKLVDEELSLILKRAREGKLHILPVVVSPALLSSSNLSKSLHEYQFVNSFSEPLSILSESRQNEILRQLSKAVDNSLSDDFNAAMEEENRPEDKYSAALNTAIINIGGDATGINILGDRNIFFEAEERLAKKMTNNSAQGKFNSGDDPFLIQEDAKVLLFWFLLRKDIFQSLKKYRVSLRMLSTPYRSISL